MDPEVRSSHLKGAAFLLLNLLATWPAPAVAQQPGEDSTRAQIQTTLRRFYFNLRHRDWEALTSDILPAKIVAHRPPPKTRLLAGEAAVCRGSGTPLVDRSAITVQGDWAEAIVPGCAAASSRPDRFRLIYFGGRWRIVFIELTPRP